MQFGTFVAPDGARLRHALWPAPDGARRGTVLILAGRSEFIEKYQETAGDLVARGFAVRAFDWRGQGLSTRVLEEREVGHLADFDQILDDLARFVDAVARPAGPEPLVVLGHSMGGHLALRWLAERPGAAAAAILTAPMVDVLTNPALRWLVRRLARRAVVRGQGARFALGQGRYHPGHLARAARHLTGDPVRRQVHSDFFRDRPELRLGGVTWGWLDASFRSTALLLSPGYAARITAPVLIFKAGQEVLVSNSAIDRLAKLLPDCRVILYPDSRHEILMEREVVRQRFWSDVDRFLEARGL